MFPSGLPHKRQTGMGKLSDFYCIRNDGLSIYFAVAEILRQTGDRVLYTCLNAAKTVPPGEEQHCRQDRSQSLMNSIPQVWIHRGCLRRVLRLRNPDMFHSLTGPSVNRLSVDALIPEVCLDRRSR